MGNMENMGNLGNMGNMVNMGIMGNMGNVGNMDNEFQIFLKPFSKNTNASPKSVVIPKTSELGSGNFAMQIILLLETK